MYRMHFLSKDLDKVAYYLWVVFSLSTLCFILNFLCESSDDFLFLDANADWYMLKLKQKTLKNDSHFPFLSCFAFIATPTLPKCFCTFTHKASMQSPKPSKNNFRGITWVEALYRGLILCAGNSECTRLAHRTHSVSQWGCVKCRLQTDCRLLFKFRVRKECDYYYQVLICMV